MVRPPLVRLALPFASLLIAAAAAAETPPPASSTPTAAASPGKAGDGKPATATPKGAVQAPKAKPKKATATRHKKGKAEATTPIVGAVATSPAFRMLEDGKSRVFLEVSQKVEVTEQKAKGRVTYRLKGAAAPVRTSRLPLLTGFFPTPVGQVALVAQADGATLVIELREAAEPVHRVIETPRGIVIQVDFPSISPAPPASINE